MYMIPSLATVSRVSAGLNVCFKSYAENDAAFRSRSLDAAKHVPVYRNRELPDRNHRLSISRAFPQMLTDGKRTGIGKPSTESSIGPAGLQADEGKVIPLPEVEGTISYHDWLCKGEFQIPKQLIHNHTFGLDSELPDCDMDSEDGVVLNPVEWKTEMKKRRQEATGELLHLTLEVGEKRGSLQWSGSDHKHEMWSLRTVSGEGSQH